MAGKKITPAMVKKVKDTATRDKLDKKMDRQMGLKQGSKADRKMDARMGVDKFEYGKGKGGGKDKY